MAGPSGRQGETYQERSKGKDVRTSNIIAAKVGRNYVLFLVVRVVRRRVYAAIFFSLQFIILIPYPTFLGNCKCGANFTWSTRYG